jgi:hypothetical protein
VRLDAVVEESHVKKPLATIKITINTKIIDFTTFRNGDGFFFRKPAELNIKQLQRQAPYNKIKSLQLLKILPLRATNGLLPYVIN